ncbi:MAG TPA: SCE4755 family polysaccharide monooxygenase-like protein [Longimicrobiaceae bacterium]|nr:SCE4755 family polysaccharide monooxygenase-like protein [Longimicrobiaceae bacterium]
MNLTLRWGAIVLAAGLLVLVDPPQPAEAAHVCMDFPISRVGGEGECVARSPQKIGPCGVPERSDIINVFRPGQTIEVVLRETVNHPSHYRIAFNPDGEWFPDPTAVDDINPDAEHVLVDGIVDAEEAVQRVEITFPDIECENCTLQLIQVMYDKQANGFGGRNTDGGNDDLYYSCADIALRGAASADASDNGSRGKLLPGLAGLSLAGMLGIVLTVRRRR